MLTLPKIADRAAQPYVAIRQKVTIPFGEAIGPIMGELFGTINAKGIQPSGPVFFKYNIVNMPELEIEFGVPVASPIAGDGRLVSGTLPAGRYAELTYWGHYDNLMDANAVLIGWAKQRELAWDSTDEADGEHFAARVEIYPNSPDEEPDPEKWETTVAIKVKE
jgi:effector-binding domain-containing protein